MQSNQWKELYDKIQELLRLQTDPIGVTMLKPEEPLPKKPIDYACNFCQLVCMARYVGRATTARASDMVCAMGASALGLIRTPHAISSGLAAVGHYTKDLEAGKRFFANAFKIGDTAKPYGGVWVESLRRASHDPEVVVFYVHPDQLMRLIHASVYETGEKVSADSVAEAALCSGIAYSLVHQKPIVGFPCVGDRMYGGTQPSELVFCAPYSYVRDVLLEGLEQTQKGKFSMYPITPNMRWTPKMPEMITVKPEDLSVE